ncbi:MAG TPA: hypothetical protein VM553_05825 [Dongiaceae bacterium]|jgi:hypothetical protein|nr:hypothetical protein [Dongiaceae bacterium]
MKANILTFDQDQARSYLERNRRHRQIYMYKFDVDVVFRKGKLDNDQLNSVRYKEDERPQKSFNRQTRTEQDKKNDIVTYKMPGSENLYVLARSGGVSLFDGMSSKVKLGKNDCWWVLTKVAKLEEGLVIAKDIFADSEGNTHYSIEPDRDMLLSEYIEKLEALKRYVKQSI